jgi:hypothetical protein
MVDGDALQLCDWLDHVDVLDRLDRPADDHSAGGHSLSRRLGMGRCGSGGQDAGSHWTCIAHGVRTRTCATKVDLGDTAASSQQLDEALLVSLVRLGTQSTDGRHDVRTYARMRH